MGVCAEQYDDEHDEIDEQREGPDPDDLRDDEDETPTEPCPHCGHPIFDYTPRCTSCGEWLPHAAPPSARRGVGFLVVVGLLILSLLLWLMW